MDKFSALRDCELNHNLEAMKLSTGFKGSVLFHGTFFADPFHVNLHENLQKNQKPLPVFLKDYRNNIINFEWKADRGKNRSSYKLQCLPPVNIPEEFLLKSVHIK